MLVKVEAPKRKEWSQYAVRFALGGLITAITGIVANKFGPGVGGLFLAFPAIFPASVTLVEKTERNSKRKKGLRGDARGRSAAALDAYGAALGSVALIPFAVLIWLTIPNHTPWVVLFGATAVWTGGAVSAWVALRWLRHHRAASRVNNRHRSLPLTRIE
jgi:hypothetical protein